jgi:hypothetical protein
MKNETLNIPGLLNSARPFNPHRSAKTGRYRLIPWRISLKTQTRLGLIASIIVAPGLLGHAMAQVAALPNVTLVQITGPGSAYPTEHLSLCYSKLDYPYTPEDPGGTEEGSFVPKEKATVTLRIVDITTGAEKVKNVILLTPGILPSDPCVEFVVPAVTTTSTSSVDASIESAATTVAPASTPAYVGVVSVSSQPLPPSAVTSSLQIFTPGVNGLPTNVRFIPPAVTCPANDYPCAY